jgi:protein TonB
MASPAKVAQDLPETLPENFSGWDGDPSPSSEPRSADTHIAASLQAAAATGQAWNTAFKSVNSNRIAVPSAQSAPPSQLPVSGSDRSAQAFTPAVASQRVQVDALVALPRTYVSTTTHLPYPTIAGPAPSQPIPFQVEGFDDPGTTKKRAIGFVVGTICVVLLLLTTLIPVFTPRKETPGIQAIQELHSESVIPSTSDVAKTAPGRQPSQQEPLSSADMQRNVNAHEQQVDEPVNPPQVEASAMEDQLNAPSRISHNLNSQVAEDSPAPASFGAAASDDLADDATKGVFAANAQPVVKAAASRRVAVPSSTASALLVQKTTPVYPLIAKTARISGTVLLQALISKTGTVQELSVLSGPEVLRPSALNAVKTWRYKPYLVSDEPVEFETTITVVFSINR